MATAEKKYRVVRAEGEVGAAQVAELLQERAEDAPLPVLVVADKEAGSRALAAYVQQEVAAAGGSAEAPGYTLGLATGSTPVPLYKELAARAAGGWSMAGVRAINLDEYYPIAPDDRNSYRRFMREQLFDHVDVAAANQHIPDGTAAEEALAVHCAAYEARIAEGVDLQVLGIGRDGHIGFNEPGSARTDATRLVHLHPQTIADAAVDFGGEEHVPRRAITMGVASILSARQCVLMAWGTKKAPVMGAALAALAQPTAELPASFLAEHRRCLFIIDEEAAAAL